MGDALTRYRMRAVYVAPPPPPPPGEALITTRTLVNTSGSTQAGGFVAPKFGVGFSVGDVPSGQYPQFKKTDGTALPATIMSLAHYDDGSVRMCTAMVRWPDDISGSATATIEVWSGGGAPSASALDETDITAADIKHELVGVTNLTGTWTSACNDGITAADFILIGTGPAGASYRIREPFNNGTVDHAQLRCWFYVDVLQDGSGNMAGLRYATRAINGYADHATDANRFAVTSRILNGATEIKAQQGYDLTETLGSNINLPHYSSLFGVQDDGTNFFVAGSQATECTIRVTLDTDAKTYLRASGLVPAWDMTITPSATSSVNYYPMALAPMTDRNNDHTGDSIEVGVCPTFNSKHFLSQAANDERASRVASLNLGSWRTCARRKATELPVPSSHSSFTGLTSQVTWYLGSSETGYTAPASTNSLWLGERTPSHRPECHYYPYLMFGEQYTLDMLTENAFQIMAHILPGDGLSGGVYASPITGSFTDAGYSLRLRYFSVDGTSFGPIISPFHGNANRWCAWAIRDVSHAYAVQPTVDPTGADVAGPLEECIEQTIAFNVAYNAFMPASWGDGGFQDWGYTSGSHTLTQSSWTLSYLMMALAHARALFGQRASVAWYHDNVCKHAEGWATTHGLWNWAGFYQYCRDESNVRIEDIGDAMGYWTQGSITWSAATDLFTLTSGGTSGNFNFTSMTNGDVIAFGGPFDSSKPYTVASQLKQYVVNASGSTFQLADTPGGAAKDVTSDGAMTAFWGLLQNPSPSFAAHGRAVPTDPGAIAYLIPQAIRYSIAAGSTILVNAASQAETILTSAKGGSEPAFQTSNNKFAFVSAI